MKLVLATRNLGKVKELTAMLDKDQQREDIHILSLQDFPDAPEVIEDRYTYEENAAKKATVIADYTGLRTLADDAGLEVDALNGAPGVHSKRWAGDDATDAIRVQKLLEAIEGTSNRSARFIAAIAIAEPTTPNSDDSVNRVQVVVGKCEGNITYTPAGDSGLGNDQIFLPIGYEKTFA
ncbi:MAG: non-canonical purine NTP pyrophosphatase, partial [Candidatus Poribacteria bacterium]|nr:non-canonical purine NTP pyrophosphatase [Candidatus Poribacteria bacterium]